LTAATNAKRHPIVSANYAFAYAADTFVGALLYG